MSKNSRMQLMKELKGNMSTHDCPKCDGPAYCAMEDGKSLSACWCMHVPHTESINDDKCMCRTCLTKEE